MASWGDGHPPHGMRSPQTSPNPQLSGGPQLGGIISLLESPILTRPGANILTLLFDTDLLGEGSERTRANNNNKYVLYYISWS